MTITTQTSYVTLAGNGGTTVFPYSFLIPTSDALVVSYTSLGPNSTTVIVPQSQYSFTGIGNAAGGTVTYNPGSPIPTGSSITIQRVLPIVQQSSISNQGGFYPQTYEAALDYLTMVCQDLNALIGPSANVIDTSQFLTGPQVAVGINYPIFSNQYLGVSESSARSFQLRTRSNLTSFPVPFLRPLRVNSDIAFDLMPNGTPPGSGTALITWIDCCDVDCSDTDPAIRTMRIGMRWDAGIVGTQAINGAAQSPLYMEMSGIPIITLNTNQDVGVGQNAATTAAHYTNFTTMDIVGNLTTAGGLLQVSTSDHSITGFLSIANVGMRLRTIQAGIPLLLGVGGADLIELNSAGALYPVVTNTQTLGKTGNVYLGVYSNSVLFTATIADAAAANGTLYVSSSTSKLSYKDGGGTVNPLY